MCNPLQATVYNSLVRYLIQRQITCSITGKVLDVDTAVVFLDTDGDPALVYHESTREAFESSPETLASLAAKGFTLAPVDQPHYV